MKAVANENFTRQVCETCVYFADKGKHDNLGVDTPCNQVGTKKTDNACVCWLEKV